MSHISYSELKECVTCPWKHKLTYIEKIKEFSGNEYTAFGTAIHYVCEKSVMGEPLRNFNDIFNQKFLEELKILTEKKVDLNKKLISEIMKIQSLESEINNAN